MKKILLIAAVAALIFPACTKEDNNNSEVKTLNVALKLPNVQPLTRSIGLPGETPVISLNDGQIFIISPTGNVTNIVALDKDLATTATGQIIPSVPSNSQIFVLGNVPLDVNVASITTLTQLLATTSDIFGQTDYTVPALGNANGTPVGITVLSETEGEAKVTIRPLYSRIELSQVLGGTNTEGGKITAFKITGVWVDAWRPAFTMSGQSSGTIYNQLMSTDFAPNTMGEEGNWPATDVSDVMTAIPSTGNVWYHHVPAGGLPRLIIRVEGIKYQPTTGDEVDLTADAPSYITVKNYTVNSAALTTFAAGHIYKIGGAKGITFSAPDNTHVVPNPSDIELTLTVEIEDWVIVNPDAELY